MRTLLPTPRIGDRFGRLVVVDGGKFIGRKKASECRCDCGRVKTIRNEHLKRGMVRSCGCLQRDMASSAHFVHGGKGTRLYTIWKGMNERCNNPNSHARANYHDKGITVCDEWGNFSAFREWAVANGYAENLTIDRIDNDRGYSPENCRWVGRDVQSLNRRVTIFVPFNGRKVALAELARETGIPYGTLYDRMSHGRPLTETKKQKRERK